MKRIISLMIVCIITFISTVPAYAKSEFSEKQLKRAEVIAEFCTDHWNEYGVLPSVAIAQALQESTLGEHCPDGSNNYWGIQSGAEHYPTLTAGVRRYCEVINNGCYENAPFNKSWSGQIRAILNGGYCEPVGSYYEDVCWLVEHFNLTKYDKKLFKLLAEQERKAEWDKKWLIVYDKSVDQYTAKVDKSLIRQGAVIIGACIYEVKASGDIKGREIHIGNKKFANKKLKIEVIENAKG